MTACDRNREWIVEALYAEIRDDAARALQAHLGSCSECAALYDEMRATLKAMDQRRRPDPGADFWDGYWERLEKRVARDEAAADTSRFERRRSPGSWGYRVAAAVIVLAAGVWIGRSFFAPGPSTRESQPVHVADGGPATSEAPAHERVPQGPTEEEKVATRNRSGAIDEPAGTHVRPRTSGEAASTGGVITVASADERARRYIDQSQVVLLEILNAGDNGSGVGDVAAPQRRAQQLVAEAGPLRAELTDPGDRRLRELVDQLQLILREIAHMEETSDPGAVDVIRSRVNRQGVLLRIDLEQMREKTAEPDKKPTHKPGDAID